MLTFDPKRGTFTLMAPGFSARGGTFRVATDRFTLQSDELSWSAESGCFVAVASNVRVILSTDGKSVSATVQNTGTVPFTISEIAVVSFPPECFSPSLSCADHLQYLHPLSFARAAGVGLVGQKTAWADGDERSSMGTVFHQHRTGDALLIGSLPPSGALCGVEVLHSSGHREGGFGFALVADCQAQLPPGSALSATFLVLAGSDPLRLLTDYGDAIAEQCPPRCGPPIVGWNSWDYYAGAIQRRDMDENLDAAMECFGDQVTHFVIDEGWECQWGVWQANWKFSEGLEAFCCHVKEKGKAPGLWTAPFLVNSYTPLYRDHPELFACDEDGSPRVTQMGYGPMAVLDTTHPRVIELLVETFSRLRACGVEYFKIDFLVNLLDCVRFHDPTIPRGEIVRRGVEAIRRAIGDEAYLLVCGAPFESVVGLAEGARVSGDIHTYWGHLKRNARSVSSRFWMHGRLWTNDPDFFVVRSTGTSDDPIPNRKGAPRPYDERNVWNAGRPFNLEEAQTHALMQFLSGGDLILGDALRKLRPNGIELIRRVLDHRLSAPAVPIDLFDPAEDVPARWVAVVGDRAYVGIFNWKEFDRTFDASPAALGIEAFGDAMDFWTEEGVSDETLRNLTLRARSSRGLVFRRRAKREDETIQRPLP